jgi:NTE family protein
VQIGLGVHQGGSALGAYQGGVYLALHEAGVEPDWIIGTFRSVSLWGALSRSDLAGLAVIDQELRRG